MCGCGCSNPKFKKTRIQVFRRMHMIVCSYLLCLWISFGHEKWKLFTLLFVVFRELLDQAYREQRVLLTRDAKLLRHQYLIKNQIYRVKNLLKNEQLLEVHSTCKHTRVCNSSEKQISFAFSTTILSWLNFKNIWYFCSKYKKQGKGHFLWIA